MLRPLKAHCKDIEKKSNTQISAIDNICGISSKDLSGPPGNSGYISLFVNNSTQKKEKEELLLSVLMKYLTSFSTLKSH